MTELPEQVAEILQATTMTLATSEAAGDPHAAPVYFAAGAGLALYFFSDPHSLHGQHLARNRRAAAAIYPECRGWQEIRGLQIHGAVDRLQQGADWQTAWQAYSAKFPFVTQLKAIVARNALYRLQPTWLRLVDNRQGFGFKQEWTLA